MGRNGKSLVGISWEWGLVTKLGMGMGRNGKQPAWEGEVIFPFIFRLVDCSDVDRKKACHC